MSFDDTAISGVMRVLGMDPAQAGLAGAGATGASGAQAQAFATHYRMAQSLFTEPSREPGDERNAFAMDQSLMQDAMMMDALATISRLTQNNPEAFRRFAGNDDTARQVTEMLGGLSAMFESGGRGIEAVGFDRTGGTSYGKYQIASRTGTMEEFLSYLDGQAPDIAGRLRQAGPADTGSANGAMPDEWRAIAHEQPERFERLQHDFVRQSHYAPAREMILEATGLDLDQAPQAIQEVLWSTSVQHGATGAARIFERVISAVTGDGGAPDFQQLIRDVYASRGDQFSSSTSRVRGAVQSRFDREQRMALAMLGESPLDRLV